MTRYGVCGVSTRAIGMYVKPMVTRFADVARLVGLLDKDPLRFKVCEQHVPSTKDVPRYDHTQFDRMVEETQPDTILVVSADHSHAGYAVSALNRDLDVIIEKPMTTSAADARAVMEAEARSRGAVRVTFNYRYTAAHRKIKEMILEGRVGRITSVDLNWYVDTHHGPSYFKRWNRRRDRSGGLSIHKCCHHFDLLNWWVDQDPVEVFAFGALNYYGAEAEMNPAKEDGRHCLTCPVREKCAYEMRWFPRHRPVASEPELDLEGGDRPLGKEAGAYTDYSPDMCIFDSDIAIEDTYTATIKYSKGAMVAYSANFSSPYEGYRLTINGTHGRIESMDYHSPRRTPFPVSEQTIDYLPLFHGAKETIVPLATGGGHGGGDPVILQDLFMGPDPQRDYEILAGSRAGAMAVALGEAVYRSCHQGRPVRVQDLLA